MYQLSLENVQTLTNILQKDILESSALLNSSLFEQMGIKVLTGIEYQQSVLQFHRKGGTSRQYKAGSKISSTIGALEERKLEVTLDWNRYEDNIQNYREKEPFSVLGTNSTYNAPNSEFQIRQIGKSFAEDIMSNLVWGKKSLGVENPLGLFDGLNVQIDREVQAGKARVIELSPFVDQPEGQAGENWSEFVKFVNGLHPKMRRHEKVLIYCSPETHMRIVDGYLKTYTGLQTPNAADPSFRFLGMPNIQLIPHVIWGEGDRLIATLPENFEFGVDTLNDWNSVKVDHAESDFNVIIYQIQSAQGTRIAQTGPEFLAVSSGTNQALDDMSGDYQKAAITVKVTGGNPGSCKVAPQKADYAPGEKVTLTVTPGSGKKFLKWSDNVTINPRTIVATGAPEVYEAICDNEG